MSDERTEAAISKLREMTSVPTKIRVDKSDLDDLSMKHSKMLVLEAQLNVERAHTELAVTRILVKFGMNPKTYAICLGCGCIHTIANPECDCTRSGNTSVSH